MTNLEKAARQALVALEDVMSDFDGSWALADTAITALREALASRCQTTTTEQAEPSQLVDASLEPVAWILTEVDGTMDFDCQPTIKPTQNDYDALREGETFTPLYAAPVRTKDLTDDEIAAVTGYRKSGATWPVVEEVARAVIAADREKNK